MAASTTESDPPIASPSTGIGAPLPVASIANNNATDIPSAPPLKIGPPKRYDDEQNKQLQKIKSYIDEQTKISTVSIIEVYFKHIQETYDFSYCPLFQNIPVGVIHLCYTYCTQFNNYLVFRLQRYSGMPEIHILGIKDIQRTSKKTSKQIKKLKADKKMRNITTNRDAYTPQLTLSTSVSKSLSDENVPFSAIFQAYTQRATGGRGYKHMDLAMLYFYSPYFYDYQLDIDNKKKLRYHQYRLPQATHAACMTDAHSLFHVPFSNQLLLLHADRVSAFDVYNMQWLSNASNYEYIQLTQTHRVHPAMCLYGRKLFLCGGSVVHTDVNVVESLDCFEIVDLYETTEVDGKGNRENKCQLKSVKVRDMVCTRSHCDGDAVSVKQQLVVGGGTGNSLNTSKSIEFYDLNQDKWMLHKALTKYENTKALVWCSGNLVFVTGSDESQSVRLSAMGCIECIDIREGRNQWQLLDQRNFQKMMNMFNRQDKDAWKVKKSFHLATLLCFAFLSMLFCSPHFWL